MNTHKKLTKDSIVLYILVFSMIGIIGFSGYKLYKQSKKSLADQVSEQLMDKDGHIDPKYLIPYPVN